MHYPFWICFLSINLTYAQEHRFNTLTIKEGLMDNIIYEVFEDKDGFMWFGTSRGLQRYDGYQFQTFSYDPTDSSGLMYGFIRSLAEDQNGNLWIGSQSAGLAKYVNGQFTHYQYKKDQAGLSHNNIETLLPLDDGSLMIGTWGGGLNILRDGDFTVYQYNKNDPNSINSNNVVSLSQSHKGGVWIGMWEGGLDYFENGSFEHIDLSKFSSNGERISVHCVLEASDGSVWIGMWDHGLIRYKDGIILELYKSDLRDKNSISNGNLLALSESKDGAIWASTYGGGTNEIRNGVIRHVKKIDGDNASLKSNRIESSFVDTKGNLWLGTNGGGVSKLINSGFRSYRKLPEASKSILHQQISAISGDNLGNIYLGTLSGGFSSLRNGEFNHIIDDNHVLKGQLKAINTILIESTGEILIGGQYDGILRYSNGKFSKTMSLPQEAYDFVYQLSRSKSDALLAATWGAGLVEFQDDRHRIYSESGPESMSIGGDDAHCVLVNEDSTIWVGTLESGISVIKRGEIIKRYIHDPYDNSSLDNNQVVSMFSTRDGEKWIGTWGGALNNYQKNSDNFVIHKNALEYDSDIRSIVECRDGYLWLGTGKGIARFDRSNNTFTNFSFQEGVDSQPFLSGSSYYDHKTETVYMGGENGLTVFKPKEVLIDSTPPSIIMTDFMVLNKSDLSALYQKEITLTYDQNFLTFGFTSINSKGYFSYYLDGLENDWNPPTKQRSANYTNLPPGRYHFKVRASNEFNTWGNTYTSTLIYLEPPFWNSAWFRAFLILFLVTSIVGVFRIRTRVILQRSKTLEESVSKRTQELFEKNRELSKTLDQLKQTQSKLVQSEKMAALGTLTAGVAHEINNPVNFVYVGINSLEQNLREVRKVLEAYKGITSANVKSKLSEIHKLKEDLQFDKMMSFVDRSTSNIKKGASRTSEIVNSLRVFSRADRGKPSLIDLQENIENTLLLLGHQFKEQLRIEKNFRDVPHIHGYPGKLNQVFTNILSNAIQAIEEEGVITIFLSKCDRDNGEFVEIAIRDTGRGMSAKIQQKMFEPFFTTKDVGEGTGLGLSISHNIIKQHKGFIEVDSVEGTGTTFRIYLPC